MEPGQDLSPATRSDGFLPGDPSRPDPTPSVAQLTSNPETSWRHKDKLHVSK